MTGGEEILHIDHITKKFDLSGGKILTACDDVEIIVHRGETVGIVGESGSGKSTVAKMVTFLYPVTSGRILFHGKDITALKGEELRRHRKHIQMVFQDPSTAFNPKMRVRDIICEPLKISDSLSPVKWMPKLRKCFVRSNSPKNFQAAMPITCPAGSARESLLPVLLYSSRKSSFATKPRRHSICPYKRQSSSYWTGFRKKQM